MRRPATYYFVTAALSFFVGFVLGLIFCSLAWAGQSPSRQYLKERFGHMDRSRVSCATVVSVVNQFGIQQAEQIALSYGMTPGEHLRARACLRRHGKG